MNEAAPTAFVIKEPTSSAKKVHQLIAIDALLVTQRSKTMFEYMVTWMQLKTDRRAVTALEYGLIAGAVSVVLIAAMALFGPALTGVFGTITTALTG
jgi:pilus assembly protein Flp/PilA